jgi:GNAT superfamily N-acetyltransferase
MLRFITIENNEKDGLGISKGFRNSVIYAEDDGVKVGLIKITILKSEDFYNICPSVWHYMRIWQGWVSIDPDAEDIFIAVAGYNGVWEGRAIEYSAEERKACMKVWEEKAKSRMKKTLDILLDQPFVCFVEVEESHRGTGVAQKLYAEASELCKGWGFSLYSDTNQTPQAKRVWEKLVSEGKATSLGNRFKYSD